MPDAVAAEHEGGTADVAVNVAITVDKLGQDMAAVRLFWALSYTFVQKKLEK